MTIEQAAALIMVAGLGLGNLHAGQPTDEDGSWLSQQAYIALNRIMPLDAPKSDGVVFRSHGDTPDYVYDVKERYFRIEYDIQSLPHIFRAEFVAPIGESIQRQLLTLHFENRGASVEDIRCKLKFLRLEMAEPECPRMRRQVKRLAKIHAAVPTFRGVIIHGETFNLMTQFGDGRVDAEFLGARHALVRWAVETFDELQKCADQISAARTK